jgi:hypothetical protein
LELPNTSLTNKLSIKLSLNMRPIQLMQILFNDYHRSQPHTSMAPACKYHQHKVNYTQNLTKFLANYERK